MGNAGGKRLVNNCNLCFNTGMSQTVTIDTVTAKKLVENLENLESLKTKILDLLPLSFLSRGSSLWWEKADKEGLSDYKSGKYKSFANVKTLIKELNS